MFNSILIRFLVSLAVLIVISGVVFLFFYFAKEWLLTGLTVTEAIVTTP